MDPILNCLLSVCCPEGSPAQLAAFTTYMQNDMGCTQEMAHSCAVWVLQHFDLAEKGTLTAFKQSIARLAKAQAQA